jgi:hypothetical protein
MECYRLDIIINTHKLRRWVSGNGILLNAGPLRNDGMA